MAAEVILCCTGLFKGYNQDGSPHPSLTAPRLHNLQFHYNARRRKSVIRAMFEDKMISPPDNRGYSYQETPYRAWSTRRGILLIASLPVVSIQNDLPLFSSDNIFNVHALQVDEAGRQTIRIELRKVLSKGKAAGLLRLAFHDAGTFDVAKNSGGMNGSIIYELSRPENTGLNRSVKVLEKAKGELDTIMQVSWADLIAFAGAEAVAVCGGPSILVQLGRLDTQSPDPDGELPAESLNAAGLKECFQRKGFSTQELVALSGAHTLGNKGFGNPTIFDNSYYQILLEKPWIKAGKGNEMSMMIGLPSDHALVEDEECLRWITTYAKDQGKFFDDFASAYIKLTNSGAYWRKT
eukprot:Gb_14386 [translate_table: standard]